MTLLHLTTLKTYSVRDWAAGGTTGKGVTALSFTRGGSSWILGKLYSRSGEVLAQAPQRGGGVSVPGDV